MNKQNIFIINFNLLYEILSEIKEILPFKIIKCENEDDFIKVIDSDIKNFLIKSFLRNIFSFSYNNVILN